MCSFCRLQLWNVDGGPNDVLRPKKVIQQYWEIDKRKSRPQALTKQKYALGETSGKVTSHHKDPQPRLIQLPLLPQDGSQVGHGGERVRVQRAEVRFAPCKSSAVQGLRLASQDGTGGVGPAGLDLPASTIWKGKKGEQYPWVWIDEKDVKYNYTM